MTNISKKNTVRINQKIFCKEVRLIGEDGNQVGIVETSEALKMSQEAGFDLVEVAPKADPPVCKILDYGKYLYRQKKIEQKHKKMQNKGEMKGIRRLAGPSSRSRIRYSQ